MSTANWVSAGISLAVVIVAVATLLLQRRDRAADKAERAQEREEDRAERQRERQEDQAAREREREEEREARQAELEPNVIVRVEHKAGAENGFWSDAGPNYLEYRLEVEIVSEGDRAESVRDVFAELLDGTPLPPPVSRRAKKPSPLTRDKPVHRRLVVAARDQTAAGGFRVGVELATGRRFYSEPQQINDKLAAKVRR